jgi:hypothetical protein
MVRGGDRRFEFASLQRRVRRTFGPSAMEDGESIAEGRPTGCSVGFSPGSLTAPIAARCREHRLHAAEAHQCHAAERGARWRPGELALYEVQFGADRRKVLPPLIGRPKRQTVLRIVGEGQARRADRD